MLHLLWVYLSTKQILFAISEVVLSFQLTWKDTPICFTWDRRILLFLPLQKKKKIHLPQDVISSVPSPQSSSLSHSHDVGMHRPFPQENWLTWQVLAVKTKHSKNTRAMDWIPQVSWWVSDFRSCRAGGNLLACCTFPLLWINTIHLWFQRKLSSSAGLCSTSAVCNS